MDEERTWHVPSTLCISPKKFEYPGSSLNNLPHIADSSEDFPDPTLPTIPTNSPFFTSKLIPSKFLTAIGFSADPQVNEQFSRFTKKVSVFEKITYLYLKAHL